MQTKELQKEAVEIVDATDRKSSVNRDAQLNFTQLAEEVGGLAKDINKPMPMHTEPDRSNLEGEFADVFMLLSKQAETAGVDIEKAVARKIEIIKKRHGLE